MKYNTNTEIVRNGNEVEIRTTFEGYTNTLFFTIQEYNRMRLWNPQGLRDAVVNSLNYAATMSLDYNKLFEDLT